uniref:Dynamin N-terminal domain-containing protein n=1 Tax=Entomoneis paludosa TaxID=265537 RepID=A0A7S2V7X1_9STRA
MLLGNHSSGKSSFINHVLGRDIQTTGVAPTDDSFTIVAPGPQDRDQDGPAVIGDPDLGFGPLRQFGPTLMHHVQLKIRSQVDSNFLIVDTPGMIDAPGNYSGMIQNNNTDGGMTGSSHASSMDRGYDFTGVVSWLADRADVVCLFFDPDKPGTTGETLSILLHALSGMDHKLLIVLNKADQFSKIHDFARAYGSLCWNLSKVIPRKDLPRIFTMCLPVEYQEKGKQQAQQQQSQSQSQSTNESTATNATNDASTIFQNSPTALQDLLSAREEVVAEVRKAPARRMDNWITGLHDAVAQLKMHATLLQDIQTRYNQLYWDKKWQEATVAMAGASVTALFVLYGMDFWAGSTDGGTAISGMVVAGMGTSTVLSTGGMMWYHGQQLQEWQALASKQEELFATFQRTHGRAIQEGDEYIAAVWHRIRPSLALALQTEGITSLARVTPADLDQLQHILKEDIPRLRRLASPPHYGK